MRNVKCFIGEHNYKIYSYQNGILKQTDYDENSIKYYHNINFICTDCGKIKSQRGCGNLTNEQFEEIKNMQNLQQI